MWCSCGNELSWGECPNCGMTDPTPPPAAEEEEGEE